MFAGACYLPELGSYCGRDAHFIWEEYQAFGVADVGEFSLQLINNAMRAINNEPKGAIDLRNVLRKAFSNTRAIGQSTACIPTLRDKVTILTQISLSK